MVRTLLSMFLGCDSINFYVKGENVDSLPFQEQCGANSCRDPDKCYDGQAGIVLPSYRSISYSLKANGTWSCALGPVQGTLRVAEGVKPVRHNQPGNILPGLPWRLAPARACHPFRARKASLVQGARQSPASAHSRGSWEGVGGFAKEAGHSSFFVSSPGFPIHTSAGGRRTRGGRENRSGCAA